jgi:hypothetical protein
MRDSSNPTIAVLVIVFILAVIGSIILKETQIIHYFR